MVPSLHARQPASAAALRQRRLVAVAQALVTGVMVLFAIVLYHGQITRFFRIGDRFPMPPALSSAYVYHGNGGYDGSLYLALALDPLARESATIATLGDPAYRSRRILYPAAGFLLGAGDPAVIPFVLVALNLCAFVTVIGVVGRGLMQSSGRQEGLLCVGLAGAWISALFGTPELVEAALLVSAVLSYRRERWALVGVCLGLAMLCRETAVLVFVGFAAAAVWKRQRVLISHLAWAWVPAAAWNLIVWRRFASIGSSVGVGNFAWPFTGLFAAYRSPAFHDLVRSQQVYWVVSAIMLVAVAVVFVWHARDISRVDLPLALSGLGYVSLLIVMGTSVLGSTMAFPRAFLPLYLFCLIGLLDSGHRRIAVWLFGAHGLATAVWLVHLGIKEFAWR